MKSMKVGYYFLLYYRDVYNFADTKTRYVFCNKLDPFYYFFYTLGTLVKKKGKLQFNYWKIVFILNIRM